MSWAEVTKVNSDLSKPLDELMQSGAIPVVKSVQRGLASASNNDSNTVTISAINPDKAIVILKDYWSSYAKTYSTNGAETYAHASQLISLTDTQLVFSGARYGYYVNSSTWNSYGVDVSWQVIEFY